MSTTPFATYGTPYEVLSLSTGYAQLRCLDMGHPDALSNPFWCRPDCGSNLEEGQTVNGWLEFSPEDSPKNECFPAFTPSRRGTGGGGMT